MMRSLFSGVSGLKNHQTRMDVIGNNISNVNTTGFKSSRVTFVDTLQQTLTGASRPSEDGTVGGTNPKQIGLGSSVGSIDMIMTDGSVQTTGKNTDLCLSGNGFFIVKKGTDVYYTRDGAFEFDANGDYVLPGSGLYVQGWEANDDGTIETSEAPKNIHVEAGGSIAAKETTDASYVNNLDASVDGARISGCNVIFADGTSETVSVYNPVQVGQGIVLNCGDRTIPLDDTAEVFDCTGTGDVNYGNNKDKRCWTSSVEAMAGPHLIVTLDGSAYEGIKYKGGIADINVDTKGKFYTIGDKFELTQTIKETITHNPPDDKITLKFDSADAITEVTIPVPNDMTVAVGDEFTFDLLTLSGVKGDGSNPAKARFDNGEVLDTPVQDWKIGDSFEAKLKDYNVTTLDSKTTSSGESYFYKGKKVDNVKVIKADGEGSVDALIGANYETGKMFYPSCATTVTAYDEQGNAHEVPILFTKTEANTWGLSFAGGTDTYTIKEADGSITKCKLKSTDLIFDSNGRYNEGSASVELTYDDINGSGPTYFTVDLSGLTQYAGGSTIVGKANGYPMGTLSSVSIDSAGVITGSYNNGLNKQLAQVALAQFANASGLTKTGTSLYKVSNNSGDANIKDAATLGVTITPSALEMSNVDLANEFSDMIITQRGFQSNSKIITVSDEMLETLVNMKR